MKIACTAKINFDDECKRTFATKSAKCGHLRSLGERGNGGFRDLLAPLLDEVTTIWNLERRGTPAYLLAQCCHHRRSQYRVFHPDGHERRPAPLMRPPFSGAPRDVYALHLGRHHHQLGKASYARLKARVRKRRGVGFGFRIKRATSKSGLALT